MPVVYQNMSEAAKRRWADPAYRARCVESFKAARRKEWNDPEIRAARCAALRQAAARPDRKLALAANLVKARAVKTRHDRRCATRGRAVQGVMRTEAYCESCASWWPVDARFFRLLRDGNAISPCLTCLQERRANTKPVQQ